MLEEHPQRKTVLEGHPERKTALEGDVQASFSSGCSLSGVTSWQGRQKDHPLAEKTPWLDSFEILLTNKSVRKRDRQETQAVDWFISASLIGL